jgi:hypothetical protein
MPSQTTSPSQSVDTKQPFQVARARCGQCGRELRHVPFSLKNIMCRDCYGLDRYRRSTPTATAWVPEKPIEVAMTDEESPTSA